MVLNPLQALGPDSAFHRNSCKVPITDEFALVPSVMTGMIWNDYPLKICGSQIVDEVEGVKLRWQILPVDTRCGAHVKTYLRFRTVQV